MKKIVLMTALIIMAGCIDARNFDYPNNRFNAGVFLNNTIAETFARGGYGRLGISAMAEYRAYKNLSFMLFEGLALLEMPFLINAEENYNALFNGVTIYHDITSVTLLGAGAQFFLLDGYQFIYYAAGLGYRNYSINVTNNDYNINTDYSASNAYVTHGIMLGGRNRLNERMDFVIHYYHSIHNTLDSFLSAGILFRIF